MSATLSEATGRPYGIQRVCQAWERSRSALYARQTREQQRHKGEEPARRGPTPTVSDATLLEAIQADLDRSPFQGEGHRKVHARLRILDGIRVARTRVLRVMRAHKLLSPHRGRQGAARVHAGTIVTQAPNVMWGTDGVRVFTLDDGWGWIFTAVEHWNAECVGWHVCKVGSRFAALEPIAQGLRRIYGTVDAWTRRSIGLAHADGRRRQYLECLTTWECSTRWPSIGGLRPRTTAICGSPRKFVWVERRPDGRRWNLQVLKEWILLVCV